MSDEPVVGAKRLWRDLPNPRGPMTVLRINKLTGDVYVQWGRPYHRTTDWLDRNQYRNETVPAS